MGTYQENIYSFTHRLVSGGGLTFGFRRHQDSVGLESEVSCTHGEGTTILDAAAIDQATFDAAAGSQFGTWFTSLGNGQKAKLRECCLDMRAL